MKKRHKVTKCGKSNILHKLEGKSFRTLFLHYWGAGRGENNCTYRQHIHSKLEVGSTLFSSVGFILFSQ